MSTERDNYAGRVLLSRNAQHRGRITGATARQCFEGCRGLRLAVKWEDGTQSFPCTKGLTTAEGGELQIR